MAAGVKFPITLKVMSHHGAKAIVHFKSKHEIFNAFGDGDYEQLAETCPEGYIETEDQIGIDDVSAEDLLEILYNDFRFWKIV